MKADLAIRDGIVLTMDSKNRVIEDGVVGIKGDTIIYVGKEGIDADEIIDAKGGIVLPGLINSHTHIPMSLFRGLAEDIPLKEWLEDYIFPIEKRLTPELVYAGALLSCAEMIMTGTTTFCDMYIFEDEVAKAAKRAGMRCLISEALYDFPSPNYGETEKGFEYTKWLIEKWSHDPLINVAVGPHTPYTCSEWVLKRANDLALHYHVPIIIHVAETEAEAEDMKKRYEKSPIGYLEQLNMLGAYIIAVHCVYVDKKDMELIRKHDVRVVHNPECTMKLASGVSPVPEMLDMGICVALGTDGSASNNNLDLFTEMDTAAKLHKVHKMDPTVMDAGTVLKMATNNGAKALGMERIIGSLEVGKKADIIVVDTNRPHMVPLYNPFSNIVYSAIGDDVLHSIINGKVVMKDRELLTMELSSVIRDAEEWALRIKSWLA
ncbi:MAG: S-adenosylhomocysteine deaminase [Deltaproteobacteria bacterium]|nr:MAG: S-adenosylhomocysteine deaminase [Deltaproteobacteria bacterium]